jgi:hypothetical protein
VRSSECPSASNRGNARPFRLPLSLQASGSICFRLPLSLSLILALALSLSLAHRRGTLKNQRRPSARFSNRGRRLGSGARTTCPCRQKQTTKPVGCFDDQPEREPSTRLGQDRTVYGRVSRRGGLATRRRTCVDADGAAAAAVATLGVGSTG